MLNFLQARIAGKFSLEHIVCRDAFVAYKLVWVSGLLYV